MQNWTRNPPKIENQESLPLLLCGVVYLTVLAPCARSQFQTDHPIYRTSILSGFQLRDSTRSTTIDTIQYPRPLPSWNWSHAESNISLVPYGLLRLFASLCRARRLVASRNGVVFVKDKANHPMLLLRNQIERGRFISLCHPVGTPRQL